MNKYLLIGDGRVAQHMAHYLSQLKVDFVSWSRRQPTGQLVKLASQAKAILLLISDSAIAPFIQEHPYLVSSPQKRVMHFSGALQLAEIESAHPLMTFGPDLYDLETYLQIPFVTVRGRASLSELLPELKNTDFAISAEKKPLYHALCSMSGNFSTILWEHAMDRFEQDLGLPREALSAYLLRSAKNISKARESVLTGPLARGDSSTIIRHLDALANTPDQKLYYAFLNFYLEKINSAGALTHEHSRI